MFSFIHPPTHYFLAPNKSQNYNVEIFHRENVHTFFKNHELLQIDSPIASRVDTEYTTAKLKWSNVNNRFNASEVCVNILAKIFLFSRLYSLSHHLRLPHQFAVDRQIASVLFC
jgi:hypothetical protein